MSIAPGILRDTLYIWLYVTVSVLDDVNDKTATADSIIQTLEAGKHIKAGDSKNQQTVRDAVKIVLIPANYAALVEARKGLMGLKALVDWTGGPKHPKVEELDSIFIGPQ